MSGNAGYTRPDAEIGTKVADAEIERKGSRFIATAYRVTHPDQAKPIIAALRERHPKARHHCWAATLDDPDNSLAYQSNDDGEPSGTAGKPMLNVIKGWPIGECLVVVTRYFGGVKLGTGGLVRAYGDATKAVLPLITTVQQFPMTSLRFTCSFDEQGAIKQLCHQFEIPDSAVQIDYAAELSWRVRLLSDQADDFLVGLREATKGRLDIERVHRE